MSFYHSKVILYETTSPLAILRILYTEFDVQLTVHRDNFLQQNQRYALISQIYFWNETLHVSDSSSVHHQKFFYCTNSNGICHTGHSYSL